MRQPSILDVVRAVTEVGAAHPEVATWWYAPPQRLRLRGELPPEVQEPPPVEVVVELGGSPDADYERIAGELAAYLSGGRVRVRAHRGANEERQLFRLRSKSS